MPADSDTEDKPKPFLGLSGTQTIGSALAAVTSALVGSFLGVAGTLIGAALGSIIATVGGAVFARTLSSATTVALKRIPVHGNRILPDDDGDVEAASAPAEDAPAESKEPRASRVWRQFTPKTWIKIGAASAAAFVLAMVSITAVEFGTSQPISSLVSSTSSIEDGTSGPTTTLGKAFSGNTTVPDETDETPKEVEEAPEQVEEGATQEDAPATDGSLDGGNSGSTETEEPGADTPSETPPADPAPETEQSTEIAPETESPQPAPETGQPTEPEVSPESGSAEQPAP